MHASGLLNVVWFTPAAPSSVALGRVERVSKPQATLPRSIPLCSPLQIVPFAKSLTLDHSQQVADDAKSLRCVLECELAANLNRSE
jgi:hypothetical protein